MKKFICFVLLLSFLAFGAAFVFADVSVVRSVPPDLSGLSFAGLYEATTDTLMISIGGAEVDKFIYYDDVATLEKDGLIYFAAARNASGEPDIEAAESLLSWAASFSKFGMESGAEGLLSKGTKFNLTKNVTARTEEDVFVLAQQEPKAVYEYTLGVSVKEGDRVGTVTYSDEFGNVRSSALIATCSAKTSWRYYIGAAILAAGLAVSAGHLKLGSKGKKR